MKKAKNMKHFIINKAFVMFAMIMGLLFTHIACAQTAENKQETDLPVYDEYDNETLANYIETSYWRNEISLWGTGGISRLQNRPIFGKIDNSFGYGFGIGYSYFLSKKWGLSTGLEYAFYKNKISLFNFSNAYETMDILNNPITYNTKVENYSEKLFIGILNLPISVLYQTGGNHKFFASAGLKLGLPVFAKYCGGSSVLTASGYYPAYDQTEIWQNDLGYGVFNINEKNGKLDLGVSVMGTFETGVKWNTSIGTALYTGVFVDYGFNNVLNNYYSKKQFMEYNHDMPCQPVMNTACVLTDRLSPLAFGIKVKFSFSIRCRDLLNAKSAYKNLKSKSKQDDDEYYENNILVQQEDLIKINTASVVSADTVKIEFPEEQQNKDSMAIQERQAYLEAANERRRIYNQSMDVPDYDRGIVSLTAEQKSALDYYIELMTENQTLILEITGHCCDLGSDELNMQIGQERADLAKDYLVEKGILPSRISTISKGKTEPLFPNNNEENRKKNRRLEIKIRE